MFLIKTAKYQGQIVQAQCSQKKKTTKNEIIQLLTVMCSFLLKMGEVPVEWKTADVISLYESS